MGSLPAEKTGEAVLLYVFNMVFPASPFRLLKLNNEETRCTQGGFVDILLNQFDKQYLVGQNEILTQLNSNALLFCLIASELIVHVGQIF